MMRPVLIAAALCAGLAACSPSVSVESGDGASVKINAAESGPYTLRVIAVGEGADASSVVLVQGPENKVAAARVVGTQSALLPADEAARLLSAQPAPAPGEQQVAVSLPGFNVSVAADDKEGGDGRAQVKMSIAGQEINVDASGDGADGHANVTIARASAESAVDFIEKNDKLSPETKASMRAALGL